MDEQRQIKAVVFDLGNVVLTWDVENILASLNMDDLSKEKLRQYLFNSRLWLDMDEGQIPESLAVKEIHNNSGLDPEIIQKALLAAKMSLLPIQSTVDILKELHKADIPLYCLSNMSVETYDYIKGFDFFRLFSGQVISGIEGCMKPDPGIYHLLLSRYQLTASNTLFVDDSPANIEMAQKLGIQTFLYLNNKSSSGNLRDMLLDGICPLSRQGSG